MTCLSYGGGCSLWQGRVTWNPSQSLIFAGRWPNGLPLNIRIAGRIGGCSTEHPIMRFAPDDGHPWPTHSLRSRLTRSGRGEPEARGVEERTSLRLGESREAGVANGRGPGCRISYGGWVI